MYKSPITIIQDAMSRQIQCNMENGVLKAVMNYGIDVDKEELLKALKYDREQYIKGYEEGQRDLIDRIVEQLEEASWSMGCEDVYNHRCVDLVEAIEIVKGVQNDR